VQPRHRDAWDEPFTPLELEQFAELIAREQRVMVSIAITPGSTATVDDIVDKMRPVVAAGCRTVTLCFDDLPVLDAGALHAELANSTAAAMDVDVFVVPTHYMGTSTSPYLDALIDGLGERVTLMWTGVSVVADSIRTDDAVARTEATGGRLPLLWDNVPVNDGAMRAYLHLGPYVGRQPGLRDTLSGVLLNPMLSMRASLPTIESACAWWRGDDPIEAWRAACDRDGWRLLAEATAFRGEAHWPGDRPGRAWLESVAALADQDDPDVDPWIDAARAGARICLAACDVLEGVADGVAPSTLVSTMFAMTDVARWLQRRHRTLGAGPRIRPVIVADADGDFSPTSEWIVFSTSIVEHYVSDVNAALATLEDRF
jgi:beta-N-acetylglucosaminidase